MTPRGRKDGKSTMAEQGRTLSADISRLLELKTGEDLTLGDITTAVGERGFGILFVLLSLPSALPVPAPGFSTPFGVVIFLLSLQLISGRAVPWIPEWASRKVIKRSTADRMIKGAAAFFAMIERYIKPRFLPMTGNTGARACCLLLLLMSGLMILPIPLTNTLPAMVIFSVGVALTERDGLALVGALLFGAAATMAYVAAVWFISVYGLRGMQELKEIIRARFF